MSETAAQRIWPGENPIGRKIRHAVDRTSSHWFTVIGVVGDVRWTALDSAPDGLIYYPYWHLAWQGMGDRILTLFVRTEMPPTAVTASIREVVRSVDPDVAIDEQGTIASILSKSVAQRRFEAFMVAAFAFVAVLLASIGVYGVVSYAVAQRKAEIGIRLALGAKQGDIAVLVLRYGMSAVLAGLVIGLAAAAMLTTVIRSLLFEVRSLDPLTFAAAPLLLALVAALACYLPARRGARTDPIAALHYE